ncbi:M20/M25/M40 family metallo-hydrolase [Vibrio sp. PP-XX7]
MRALCRCLLRHDALCGVAEMISAIEAFAHQHDIVATVGKCDIRGGAVNVIPGEVGFSLDIRSQSQVMLENCTQLLLGQLNEIAERRELSIHAEQIYQAQAVPCHEVLQQKWAAVVENVTGKDAYYLASGAGHDAMVMSELTQMGMLFVRCEKGISHHPKEQVHLEDVQVALQCLIKMIQSFVSSRSF